jgi:DNA helicase-2/ATP-dependent DNA helicase PcrA
MEYSKYSIDIFNEIENTNNNILVQATAGSGKTTTIVEASKRIDKRLDSLFVAFNKGIVLELIERLPKTVSCSTLHSLGIKSLYGNFSPKIVVDEDKVFDFIKVVFKDLTQDERKNFKNADNFKEKIVVREIIDYLRMNLLEPNYENMEFVAIQYGIDAQEFHFTLAERAFRKMEKSNKSRSKSKSVDFIDMIWLPSINDYQLKKFDVVFVDEAQDLNKAQQVLIEKSVREDGRVIYVGDKRQAIYGFAGADSTSFETIGAKPNTVQLPLSISYRCAKNIVREARKIFPDDIEYHEDAVEGEVRNATTDFIEVGDMVVCRNVAPLVSLYFDLTERGLKSYVKGKDLEDGVKRLLSKVEAMDCGRGIDKLYDMLTDLGEEMRKRGVEKPEATERYRNFEMKIDLIKMIAEEGCMYMKEVSMQVDEIFKADVEAIPMMTIHKSKGLENDRVFVLNPELIPSKWARTHSDFVQENNLMFVAITRAKTSLFYINGYVLRGDRK